MPDGRARSESDRARDAELVVDKKEYSRSGPLAEGADVPRACRSSNETNLAKVRRSSSARPSTRTLVAPGGGAGCDSDSDGVPPAEPIAGSACLVPSPRPDPDSAPAGGATAAAARCRLGMTNALAPLSPSCSLGPVSESEAALPSSLVVLDRLVLRVVVFVGVGSGPLRTALPLPRLTERRSELCSRTVSMSTGVCAPSGRCKLLRSGIGLEDDVGRRVVSASSRGPASCSDLACRSRAAV